MNCFIPVWLIGSWSTTINFPLNKYLFYFFQTVFDFKCLWKEVTYKYCRYYKYCKYMSYINIYLVYGKYQFLKQLKTNAFFFLQKKDRNLNANSLELHRLTFCGSRLPCEGIRLWRATILLIWGIQKLHSRPVANHIIMCKSPRQYHLKA